MGRHRGTGRARGVSKGPIIAVAVALALVLATVGWFRLRERIDAQATEAAQTCVEGDALLDVAADPAVAPTLTTLAARWVTDTRPVVRDHCIDVRVTPVATTPATTALTADPRWDPTLGPPPALWVPFSSDATARAAQALDGQTRSLATSPVVLAVPAELERALSTAGTGWRQLPSLQSDGSTLAGLGLDGWAGLRLALPTGTDADATTPALEAVAAAATDAGTGPLTAEQAASPAATSAVGALALGADALGDGAGPTTAAALTTLADGPGADGAVHAVPITEQQLHTAVASGGAAGLVEFVPAGPTPTADFPAAVVDAPWVDETLSRAAAELAGHLREPDAARVLADAGFRVDGQPVPRTDAVPFPRIEQTLNRAAPAVADILLDHRRAPVAPRATTILLDTSTSMGTVEGDDTRLAHIATALDQHVSRSPDASTLAVWVFARDLDGTTPYRATVARGTLTADQRTALTAALTGADTTDGSAVYRSLAAAYVDAVRNHTPGRPNSVLLITDSANDDDTSRQRILDLVAAAGDPDRPVRIDVVALGDDTNRNTLQTLADRTGGALVPVATTDGPDLAAAIRKLMS
ncbi:MULTISPECIES: VWA domain-containing protein [unclassified Rhodococcus (in: high G+C Gram-positive bacteria)]|uniref:VWA domain-containing protein n=1 Tax=unclassified Rhodococcus (in: high G+C Gram-positive bacteria) TaxID=192944 RepID=UPI0009FB6377|nr:VWA domain-containing protein [Rhodococcus sp. M8]QPG46201.1 VWA domain-containing protein [Rhodococcus sp. M8]